MMAPDVVVGVDAAPPSRAAADAGLRLARAGGGRCRLVHAVHDARLPVEVVGAGVALDVLHLAERARIRAEVSTSLAEGKIVPADVIGELEIRTGRAASVLDAVVNEMDAGLMVLGGKHHSALGRWGGSTVQQAVRRLNVPLLVTTGPLPNEPRILVAVDHTYAAARTAQSAMAFAALLGGSVRVLHVLEPTPAIIEAGLLPELRRRVERDIWPLFPVPDSQKVIRHGVPGEAIAQEADAWHADVIVVGSHGKGWVDRLLLGSVTEELLGDLPAAVLVIPIPPSEQHEAGAARAFRAAEA